MVEVLDEGCSNSGRAVRVGKIFAAARNPHPDGPGHQNHMVLTVWMRTLELETVCLQSVQFSPRDDEGVLRSCGLVRRTFLDANA